MNDNFLAAQNIRDFALRGLVESFSGELKDSPGVSADCAEPLRLERVLTKPMDIDKGFGRKIKLELINDCINVFIHDSYMNSYMNSYMSLCTASKSWHTSRQLHNNIDSFFFSVADSDAVSNNTYESQHLRSRKVSRAQCGRMEEQGG